MDLAALAEEEIKSARCSERHLSLLRAAEAEIARHESVTWKEFVVIDGDSRVRIDTASRSPTIHAVSANEVEILETITDSRGMEYGHDPNDCWDCDERIHDKFGLHSATDTPFAMGFRDPHSVLSYPPFFVDVRGSGCVLIMVTEERS